MKRSSFLAGVFISLGCIVNLKVGGVAGAVLFSFGLISVCLYGLKLYTGTAGFRDQYPELRGFQVIRILFWNVIGCMCASILFRDAPAVCDYNYSEAIELVVSKRLTTGAWYNFLLAIGCGFIMTTVVEFYKIHKTIIPILLGIPVFILSGFTHSIADAFYFLVSDDKSWYLLWIWICEVGGNFLGCNLYPWLGMRR